MLTSSLQASLVVSERYAVTWAASMNLTNRLAFDVDARARSATSRPRDASAVRPEEAMVCRRRISIPNMPFAMAGRDCADEMLSESARAVDHCH